MPKEEFEQTGWFETIMDDATGKVIGTRHNITPAPGRQTGYHGQVKETHTKPFTLTKGHKVVTIKASKEKPVHCTSTLFPQSGRTLWKHPLSK